jgi:membrane-associated phospholipid phosphatase
MFRRLTSKVKKFWASLALMSVEFLLIMGLFFTALIAFILTAKMIFLDKKENFDFRVFEWVQEQVSDNATAVMRFFSYLGDHRFLVPANLILIVYFLFIVRHRWYSIKIPMVAISSLILMASLKQLFGRQRPLIPLLEAAKGLSFPSGHAMTSVTFYGLLIYLVLRNFRNIYVRWILCSLLVTLILGIGFSRIYLRVHYASDVIAGFCVGVIWLFLSLWLLKKMERFSRKKVDPVVEEEPVQTTNTNT